VRSAPDSIALILGRYRPRPNRQPSLLDDVVREDRPWKRTRETSRAQLQKHVREGVLRKNQALVATGGLHLWNKTNHSFTARELEEHLLATGALRDLAHARAFQVLTRLNELADGHWTTTRHVDGARLRKRVGGGLFERARHADGSLAKRQSVVRGERVGLAVLCWRPREAGSLERGPANVTEVR